MSIERLSQKGTGINERESFKLPNWIGKYEVIGHNAYDHARKLSFALPLVAATVGSISPERAHAIEIPADATYEQGIELLSAATRIEKFETGAVFVQLPSGETRWYSVEGDEDSIDPREMLSELAKIVDSDKINDLLERGDKLNVIILHNHPQHSAEVAGLVEADVALASYPPSGAGFADGVADTGYYGHQEIAEHFAQIELEHGVDIESFQQMVDPLGIWTYQLDLDEAEKAGNELLTYRVKKDTREATYDAERMRLQVELDEVHEQIANFEYPPEWHDLHDRMSKLRFAQFVFEKTGEVTEENVAEKMTEIRTELSRVESEVGLTELEKSRDDISAELTELRSNYSDSNVNAVERITDTISQKVDSLDTLRGAWIMSAIENGAVETLHSELYDNLRRAYQDVGVRASYEPFSE